MTSIMADTLAGLAARTHMTSGPHVTWSMKKSMRPIRMSGMVAKSSSMTCSPLFATFAEPSLGDLHKAVTYSRAAVRLKRQRTRRVCAWVIGLYAGVQTWNAAADRLYMDR